MKPQPFSKVACNVPCYTQYDDSINDEQAVPYTHFFIMAVPNEKPVSTQFCAVGTHLRAVGTTLPVY